MDRANGQMLLSEPVVVHRTVAHVRGALDTAITAMLVSSPAGAEKHLTWQPVFYLHCPGGLTACSEQIICLPGFRVGVYRFENDIPAALIKSFVKPQNDT